jgi:hypothetical protein
VGENSAASARKLPTSAAAGYLFRKSKAVKRHTERCAVSLFHKGEEDRIRC